MGLCSGVDGTMLLLGWRESERYQWEREVCWMDNGDTLPLLAERGGGVVQNTKNVPAGISSNAVYVLHFIHD